MYVKNSKYIELPLLFCFALMIFLVGKQGQEVVGFESRFYLFAQEMYRYGVTWFPTTYQQPYADYSATSTFLIYLLARLLGGLNKFIALIPSALASALTLIGTYLIGCLHSKRWGFYAFLFLLCSIGFLKISRSICLDIYPTLILTYCFYYIYYAHLQRTIFSRFPVYALILLSFLFRGPIGLVMPAGVVCVFYLLNQQYKQFFLFGLKAFLILLVATFSLLALAYYVGGYVFMQDVLRMQIIGRIDHAFQPYYFYFTEGLINYLFSFPCALLTLFVVTTAYLQRKPLPHFKSLLYVFAWALVILIGMSIPGEKKIRYILPALPAFALIAAYPLAFARENLFVNYMLVLNKLMQYFPSLLLLGLIMVWFYVQRQALPLFLPFFLLATILLSAQASNYFIKELLPCFLINTLSLVLVFITVIEPLEVYLDRTREFVIKVETLRLEKHAALVFFKESQDSFPIKYAINMFTQDKLYYLKSPTDLIAFNQAAIFIMQKKNYLCLPSEIKSQLSIVADEKAGHVNMMALKKK